MNIKNELERQREWSRNFRFLKNPGLVSPCLTILALARSKREVETLHNLLPTHCRLLREDLIALKKFWVKYFSPEINMEQGKPSVRLSSETLRWLLGSQCPTSEETSLNYYLNKVINNGFVCTDYRRHNRVLSCDNRNGSGDYHFNISVSNAGFGMGCFLLPGEKTLVVSIVGDAALLNEELTHEMLGWPPYAAQEKSDLNATFGIVFNYNLNAKDFLPFLEAQDEKANPMFKDFVIKDGFLDLLYKRLKSSGLPITSQCIESIVRHRGEMEEDENLKEEETQIRISPMKQKG